MKFETRKLMKEWLVCEVSMRSSERLWIDSEAEKVLEKK